MIDSSKILVDIFKAVIETEKIIDDVSTYSSNASGQDAYDKQMAMAHLVSVLVSLKIAHIKEKSRGHAYTMAGEKLTIPRFFLQLTADGIGITYGVLVPRKEY